MALLNCLNMSIRNILFKLFGLTYNYCDNVDKTGMFVRFTNKCPNKCAFCIERNCVKSWKDISGKELARRINESGRKFISVGGGEPCSNMSRLLEFFDNLSPEITVTYLFTSLPKTCETEYAAFSSIIKRCEKVDVSVNGTTNVDDEDVYGTKLGYDKQRLIRKLALDFPDRIYVSYVMRRSKVSKLSELISFLRYYVNLGVKHFHLKELSLDKPFEKDPEYIAINDILTHDDIHGGFMRICRRIFGTGLGKSSFVSGCKIDISKKFYEYFKTDVDDNMPDIGVRRRCFRTGSGPNVTWRDVIKTYINSKTLVKNATPVINNNGIITSWFPKK